MYYCIANPSARSGGRANALPQLLSFLKKQGTPCRLYFTEGPGHAGRLARKITAQVSPDNCSDSGSSAHPGGYEPVNLIVAGGDGTFNEVINGIDNYENVRLAFLPVGSGNDLARGSPEKTCRSDPSDCRRKSPQATGSGNSSFSYSF